MSFLDELVSVGMDYFILLFLRVSGLIFSSPVFGRTVVPRIVKIGMCGALTILFYYALAPARPVVQYGNLLEFVGLCLVELIFGIVLGFVQNLFFTLPQTAGQLIDMQMGFGMANAYDPQFGVSVPMIGNILNYAVLICFFASGGHLRLLQMMYIAIVRIPVGSAVFSPDMASAAVELFARAFSLAVSLAMPVVASGLLGEAAMGIMMRTVPQVNMFVVGIPVKIVLGFIVILITMPILVDFTSVIFDTMFGGLDQMFAYLGGTLASTGAV